MEYGFNHEFHAEDGSFSEHTFQNSVANFLAMANAAFGTNLNFNDAANVNANTNLSEPNGTPHLGTLRRYDLEDGSIFAFYSQDNDWIHILYKRR